MFLNICVKALVCNAKFKKEQLSVFYVQKAGEAIKTNKTFGNISERWSPYTTYKSCEHFKVGNILKLNVGN